MKPVSGQEIKSIFFSIKDDKAPGPNGFSPFFYKKSWPILRRMLLVQ